MSSTFARKHPSGGRTRPAPVFLLLLLALLLLLPGGAPSAAPKPPAPSTKTLTYEQLPSVLKLGQAWSPVRVAVRNNGSVNTRDNRTKVTLSLASGSGALTGTLTRTVVGGIATFDNLGYSYGASDNITLRAVASDTSIPPAVSGTIRILTPVLQFLVPPASVQTVGAAWPVFSLKLTIGGVTAAADNQTLVTLSLASGTGTLSGVLTARASQGIVTFSDVRYNLDQTIQLRATASDNQVAPVLSSAIRVDSPFSVTSGSPTGNFAAINGSISIRFSKPVVPATVNSQTFVVQRAATGETLSGIYTMYDNGTRVVFRPDDLLATGTDYIGYATPGILCATDNSTLGQTYQWAFATVRPGWESFRFVPGSMGVMESLGGVASLGAGDGIVAFTAYDNSSRNWLLNIGRYDRSARDTSGWYFESSNPIPMTDRDPLLKVVPGTAENATLFWIDSSPATGAQPIAGNYSEGLLAYPQQIGPNAGQILSTRLAGCASGASAAGWIATDNAALPPIQSLWFNKRLPGGEWNYGTAVHVAPPGLAFLDHQVAVGDSGAAAAAWVLPGSGPANPVYTRVSGPDGYPGIDGSFASADNGSIVALGVAADDNVFLATVSNGNLLAYRYNLSTMGGVPFQLNGYGTVQPQTPLLSIHGSDALATWATYDGSRYDVWSCLYHAGDWGMPMRIETNSTFPASPVLNPVTTFDGMGNAFHAWTQVGPGFYGVYAARLPAGSLAWEPIVVYWSTFLPSIQSLSADEAGNAILVWKANDSTIHAARYQGAYP